MQNPKTRNHVVTRGYLTNWLGRNGTGDQGIWYFDLLDSKVKFSRGKKASFAIKNKIYAPNYMGPVPDDRLENWFAEYEGDLCDFTRTWSQQRPQKVDARRIERALIGCITLGHRSDYGLAEIEKLITQSNPKFTADEVRLAALNNCYSTIQNTAKRFTRGMSVIIHDIKPALYTNDQPFLDMSPTSTELSFAIFPLSPTAMIAFFPDFLPPQGGDFGIARRPFDPAAPALTDFVRLAAMRTARRWVVCPCRRDAEGVAEYLTEERMVEARSTDRPLFREAEVRDLFQF